jgi:hypothetical protein
MSDTAPPVVRRNFSSLEVRRAFVFFGTMAFVGGCYWFMLPGIQSHIIPVAPGGAAGPWVIRPIGAAHAGAAAVLACLTVPFISRPLNRMWQREDAASGTRYDPFRDKPGARVVIMAKACLLLLIYASALVFYLGSWTIIGPDGIEKRLPWGKRNHSFQDIMSLQAIPDGLRSDSIAQEGPWYEIRFRSGGGITLSPDNEGTTPDELSAMTALISKRSGLAWRSRADVRRR